MTIFLEPTVEIQSICRSQDSLHILYAKDGTQFRWSDNLPLGPDPIPTYLVYLKFLLTTRSLYTPKQRINVAFPASTPSGVSAVLGYFDRIDSQLIPVGLSNVSASDYEAVDLLDDGCCTCAGFAAKYEESESYALSTNERLLSHVFGTLIVGLSNSENKVAIDVPRYWSWTATNSRGHKYYNGWPTSPGFLQSLSRILWSIFEVRLTCVNEALDHGTPGSEPARNSLTEKWNFSDRPNEFSEVARLSALGRFEVSSNGWKRLSLETEIEKLVEPLLRSSEAVRRSIFGALPNGTQPFFASVVDSFNGKNADSDGSEREHKFWTRHGYAVDGIPDEELPQWGYMFADL